MQAMARGEAKALICLGGNFAVAMPDPEQAFAAMRRLDLSVHLGTKLNRSHLLVCKESYILPVIGRTELDMQASGAQSITVEDSMSMVHASAGRLRPASPQLRSEPAIVAGMAAATLDHSKVDWNGLVADYDRIRDLIERTIPGFDGYNERIRVPGGFRMPLPPTERRWPTPSGKAMFSVFPGVRETTSPGPTMCCASSPSAAMTSTTPPSTAWTTAIEACSADGTCCSCIPPTWPSAAWSMAT